jgi:hypothetical protein
MKKLLLLALAAALQQDAPRPSEDEIIELIDIVAPVPGQMDERPFVGTMLHAAIDYPSPTGLDAVAGLNRRIQDGRVQLTRERGEQGYLRAVLETLDIPVESQMLVFSKTSLQSSLISPENPRAIYFNDTVALGWVRGGIIELASQDPRQGTMFYVLTEDSPGRPQFSRRADCLRCHHSFNSLDVPGMLVRSVFPARDGTGLFQFGNHLTDHRSPMEERWGGWYVTGVHGSMRHIGNATVTDMSNPELMVTERTLNVERLAGRLDTSGYLSPHSDIVALMVFEHQMRMMNLLTRVGWEFRLASHLERSRGKRNANMERILADSTSELVDYLLFIDEAPLNARVQGTSGFAAKFSARGPKDRRGRSLRQLHLETRLMRHPCSYMIYTPAFDALPSDAKEAIYKRMWQILSGRVRDPQYARLSPEDRQAIVEILRDTKPGLPDYFTLERQDEK